MTAGTLAAHSPATPLAATGRAPADASTGDLWRSAFGDRPEATVVVGQDDSPERRWLAAVVLGGRGRYGAAWALLEPMVHSPAVPAVYRGRAAIARASHLRQLGGHRAARCWDGFGLAAAGMGASQDDAGSGVGLDAGTARVDALLGLAADALGLTEFALSRRLLERAGPLALAHPSWRPRVRLDWIRAELALSLDEPGRALDCAERAVAASAEAGATRHELKSQLVRVVARSCMGEPPVESYRSLEELAERAISSRLRSLEWPIRLLLGQLAGPWDGGRASAHHARYRQLLASIRQGCDPIGRLVLDRSPWVAAAFGP